MLNVRDETFQEIREFDICLQKSQLVMFENISSKNRREMMFLHAGSQQFRQVNVFLSCLVFHSIWFHWGPYACGSDYVNFLLTKNRLLIVNLCSKCVCDFAEFVCEVQDVTHNNELIVLCTLYFCLCNYMQNIPTCHCITAPSLGFYLGRILTPVLLYIISLISFVSNLFVVQSFK